MGISIAISQGFNEEGLKIKCLCLPTVGKVSFPLLNIPLHVWALKHLSAI